MSKYSVETVVGAYKSEPFAHTANVRKLYQGIAPQYHDEIQAAWEQLKKERKGKAIKKNG